MEYEVFDGELRVKFVAYNRIEFVRINSNNRTVLNLTIVLNFVLNLLLIIAIIIADVNSSLASHRYIQCVRGRGGGGVRVFVRVCVCVRACNMSCLICNMKFIRNM
jgi:hypothetical protein